MAHHCDRDRTGLDWSRPLEAKILYGFKELATEIHGREVIHSDAFGFLGLGI